MAQQVRSTKLSILRILPPCTLKRKLPKLNLIGRKFGRLTIEKLAGEARYANKIHWIWWCRCACGARINAIQTHLVYGNLKSCGCLKKETARTNGRQSSGEHYKKFIYTKSRRSALQRKIPFHLTQAQFINIVTQPCHYCGTKPFIRQNLQEYRYKNGIHMFNGVIAHTGVDRQDSTKGYTLKNCVPCCPICNAAKNTRTVEEFVDWLNRIVERHEYILRSLIHGNRTK